MAITCGMVWEDVQGPDRSVAVVADVYTANASNNPDKGVLHAATGYVDDIFVVVEINVDDGMRLPKGTEAKLVTAMQDAGLLAK